MCYYYVPDLQIGDYLNINANKNKTKLTPFIFASISESIRLSRQLHKSARDYVFFFFFSLIKICEDIRTVGLSASLPNISFFLKFFFLVRKKESLVVSPTVQCVSRKGAY